MVGEEVGEEVVKVGARRVACVVGFALEKGAVEVEDQEEVLRSQETLGPSVRLLEVGGCWDGGGEMDEGIVVAVGRRGGVSLRGSGN